MALLNEVVEFLNSDKNLSNKQVEVLLAVLMGTAQLTDNSGVRYVNMHGEGNRNRLVVSQPEYASRAFPRAKLMALYLMESSHSKLQHVKNTDYQTANAIAADPTKWHPLALSYNPATNNFAVREVKAAPKDSKKDQQRTKVTNSMIENDENSCVINTGSAGIQYRIKYAFARPADFNFGSNAYSLRCSMNLAALKLTYELVKLV